MKVLFICDEYYPLPQAAAACARNILLDLVEHQEIQCDVLNLSSDSRLSLRACDGVSNVYNLTDYARAGFSDLMGSKKTFTEKVNAFFRKVNSKLARRSLSRQKYTDIEKKLNEIGKEYDALVPVVSNVNNGYGTMRFSAKSGIPYILYQVDPIGSNEVLKKQRKLMMALEKKLYANAAHVFTTPLLKGEKAADGEYDIDKITAVEFPVLTRKDASSKASRETVNCLFAGNIYSGVRDCRYTLKLFELIKDSKVCLEFVGSGQEDVISSYSDGSLSGRIVHSGKLSKSEYASRMMQADILINIGNVMTNQVPSKVFDYFSTGLPIVNICANKNCPSIPYMDKYGYAINLFETEDEEETNKQAAKLENFICAYAGKQKPFEEVAELFRESTPEYIGECFANVLKEIADKNN